MKDKNKTKIIVLSIEISKFRGGEKRKMKNKIKKKKSFFDSSSKINGQRANNHERFYHGNRNQNFYQLKYQN